VTATETAEPGDVLPGSTSAVTGNRARADIFRVTVDATKRQLLVTGDLDLLNAPALLEAGQALTALPGPVDLDLARVQFIDARGLAAIISLNNQLAPGGGGRIHIVAASAAVRHTFEMAGLSFLFE
jgi:anti-anti-sigma factor